MNKKNIESMNIKEELYLQSVLNKEAQAGQAPVHHPHCLQSFQLQLDQQAGKEDIYPVQVTSV